MRKIAIAAALAALPAAAMAEGVVNVYNWSDYIGETTVADFEKETGIKVNYDVFDSNETLEAKLLSGNSGYDVVVPTANFLERQIQAGAFAPLDKAQLDNIGNMDADIAKIVARHDPDNAHAITYMWGTNGFGYNEEKIKERMPDAPVGSWDMIFNPEVAAKFADCGISLLDSASEVVPSALNYLGLDPNSEDKGDLDKAKALLLSIRPYIKYFHSSQYINDLANGEICIAMGYSGDILQARDRAAEAENGNTIHYVIPAQGAQMWFDMMAIPVDAPHKAEAHAFINYIMRPQVIADASNFVFYANGNAAATPLVSEEVTSDPGIYPSEAIKKNLFSLSARSAKYERLLTRAWTEIKTGQ